MTNDDENKDRIRQLEYAHQYYRDESRGFWTKVAALLTINSLLLIGFTTLNISCNPNPTLLLVIAASGISIQALWPLFAVQSSGIWQSLGRFIKGIEEEHQYVDKELRVGHALGTAYETLAKPLKCCMPQFLYEIFKKNPVGAISIFLFFIIFIAIWIIAVLAVDIYIPLAISLPIVLVVIPCIVYSYKIMGKIFREKGRSSMLFISLLTPKGKGSEAVQYLKKLEPPPGITVHSTYFTFGRYDGLIVFQAPDEKTAMKFVMDIGFATDYTVETMTAIPTKEL